MALKNIKGLIYFERLICPYIRKWQVTSFNHWTLEPTSEILEIIKTHQGWSMSVLPVNNASYSACMHAQSCRTLFDPMDSSPLFMELSRQEYWSGLPFPSPGTLPEPENQPAPLMFPVFAGEFQVALMVKNPTTNAWDIRDVDSIPGSGRSLGGGHSNPLQHSCLENPMDQGAWWAIVHRVAKCQTWLKRLSMHTPGKPVLRCYLVEEWVQSWFPFCRYGNWDINWCLLRRAPILPRG